MTEPLPITVTLAQLAEFFDCTERRVQQLAQQGVIPMPKKARYLLVGSVVGYIRFLRARITGNTDNIGDSFAAERIRLTKAKAQIAEIERARLAGELVALDEEEEAWLEVVGACKARLQAIPSKLARRIIAVESAIDAQRMLSDEITEALDELSRLKIVERASPGRALSAHSTGTAEATSPADDI